MANLNNLIKFLPKCTCDRRCDFANETSSEYDDDEDDDASYIDEESEEELLISENSVFISIYKTAKLHTIIISNKESIEAYRLQYLQLTDKSVTSVQNIWENIQVNMPILGTVTLKKVIGTILKKGPNKRKKQLKRPLPSMKLQNTVINSSDNSNKQNMDKKEVQEVISNSMSKSEDKKSNIKIENKSGNSKILQMAKNTDSNTVIKKNITSKSKELDKDLKAQAPVNNPKSNATKDQKSVSIPTSIKAQPNNIKASLNTDKKSNSVNNTPKINLPNNNLNKDKEKSTSTNQNSTPKKLNTVNKNENINLTNGISKAENTPDQVLKVNTAKQTNKNESRNSVSELKSPNVTEKFEKKDLTNTPSKKATTTDKNKNTSTNLSLKNSTKQSVSEFKKPLDVEPDSINAEKNNSLKINKKYSTAQVEVDNFEDNVHEEMDKSMKKKIKKQKQKEKKIEKNRRDSSNCSSRGTTDTNSPDSSINKKVNKNNNITSGELKKTSQKQQEKQIKSTAKNHQKTDTEESEVEKDSHSEYIITSDDEVDFLTHDENLPAFLAKIKEKSKNKEKNKKVVADTSIKINSKNTETNNLANGNNEQEFAIFSKKRNKVNVNMQVIDKNSIFYSESFGENACLMVLENNFMGALEYLVDAIDFNYTDQRHYLNRCYCYLSMKKNVLALADAKYILQISCNIGYLFAANVRAAQASYGLQKYDQAETYMKKAMQINPTSAIVARELIVIQVAKIVSMGFTERDAILALEKYSSMQEAINYLIENNNNNKLSNSRTEDFEISLDDEYVYSSDEDESSNTAIINRMLNYEPGTVKFQHIIAKPANANLILSANGKSGKKEKKVVLNGKANSEQEKAIWVGNLTNSITDTMLKKKFKEFGKVISVYRPLNESYAFVNFEKAEDVTNVLTNAPCHEMAGVKLIVRSAVRQK